MKYSINKDPKGPLYITEDEMKLNYNCPADQKSGEGKGSCGGAVSGEKASSGSKESSSIRKELETELIITKDRDFTPENAQKTIDHIDKVISKLEIDLAEGEKYLKEKMKPGETGSKGIENNNANLREKISAMKDINTKNKEMLQKEKSGKKETSSSKASGSKSPSKSDTGSLKGLREANDKGLITIAGKVKKDFSAGGKSYKKGDYVTHHVDGKWQDEK